MTAGTRIALCGAVMALTVAACGAGGRFEGSIRIDGSSTVGPLSEVAAELFMRQVEHRGIRVTVAMSGTSGGFQKFCNGETDINDASRPIKSSEIEMCERNGIAFEAIQVANDALSLLVNETNPVSCLTIDQVNQIWDAGSDVRTWGDVDGLDVPADVARGRLTLYGPGTDSGTFDFFTEAVNGEEGRIRRDYTNIGEDDHLSVTGIRGDRYAMAYVPYSYFQEAGEGVKPVAVDGGTGCVDATLENVQAGNYVPLGRPLFVYASDRALGRPEVLDFMRFYIDNADEIARAAAFVPLTPEQMAEQHERIEQLAARAGGDQGP